MGSANKSDKLSLFNNDMNMKSADSNCDISDISDNSNYNSENSTDKIENYLTE